MSAALGLILLFFMMLGTITLTCGFISGGAWLRAFSYACTFMLILSAFIAIIASIVIQVSSV